MRDHNYKRQLILTSWVLATLLLTGSCSCNKSLTFSPSQPGSPVENATPRGGGMPNIGNSCYMNAVLQIFKTLYPDVFEEALNNDQANVVAQAGKALMDQIKDDKAPATREAAEAFRAAIESSEGLSWKVGSSQQDAAALLDPLLDRLKFPMVEFKPVLINKATEEQKEGFSSDYEYTFRVALDGSTDKSAKSMQDWVDKEFAGDELSSYKWNEADTAPTPTIKKAQISDLEKLHNGILPIQAKRFATKGGLGGVPYVSNKIEKPILEPLSITIRQAHQYNGTQDRSYTLVAFIQHEGGNSIESGHYVAYVKQGEKWVLYNDTSVSEVSHEQAKKAAEQAYLYFYQPS